MWAARPGRPGRAEWTGAAPGTQAHGRLGRVGGGRRPGRHSIYGPARVTWARASRSFFGQRRGPGRGPRLRTGWGRGPWCPTPKYGSRRGETFLRASAEGAPAGYIKPGLGDPRPPQRTAQREASLPSPGDQGPTRRAAGVATRPGRAGMGRRQGDRVQPTHLICPRSAPCALVPGATRLKEETAENRPLKTFPSLPPLWAAIPGVYSVPRYRRGFVLVVPRAVPSQPSTRARDSKGHYSLGCPQRKGCLRL